jgi:hypothetical protein
MARTMDRERRFRVKRVILVVGRLLPVFPWKTDIVRAGRHVLKVPKADVACAGNAADRPSRWRCRLRLPRPGNWNSLWYYLYVFCNCGEQHVPTFKPQMMRGKFASRWRVLEFCFEIESFRS